MTRVLVLLLLAVTLQAGEKLTIAFPRDSLFTCTMQLTLKPSPRACYDHFRAVETCLKLTGKASKSYAEGAHIVAKFRAFGYRATTRTHLLEKPAQLTLENDVRSFEHNWKLVPKVRSGVARYRFVAAGRGTTLYYSQEVRLDRRLRPLHRFLIRWQLRALEKQLLTQVTLLNKRSSHEN